jgi:hypothetical protein
VRELVPPEMWLGRYGQINHFEAKLAASTTRIVKCFLHISREEQKRRLIARLDDPTKRWKYNPADIDERAYWDGYQQAYSDALRRCNTEAAPWFTVPPTAGGTAIGRSRRFSSSSSRRWPSPGLPLRAGTPRRNARGWPRTGDPRPAANPAVCCGKSHGWAGGGGSAVGGAEWLPQVPQVDTASASMYSSGCNTWGRFSPLRLKWPPAPVARVGGESRSPARVEEIHGALWNPEIDGKRDS